MKSPKKQMKEPTLPSQDETRRANVLREEMLSQFRMFGESLSVVRESVEYMRPKLDKVCDDAEVLKSAARTHTDAIKTNTDAIKANTEQICSLKGLVQGHTGAIYAVQSDLKNFNERLVAVEAKS